MLFTDIQTIVHWWLLLLIIGIAFQPIAALIFSSFEDAGYIFAKILGILGLSHAVFIVGILHLAVFTQMLVVVVLAIAFFGNQLLYKRLKKTDSIRDLYKQKWRTFIVEEVFFLGFLFFFALIRATAPDIHGLEKYMDFGFINSILRGDYFPPRDMWFAPYPINYYYFGHLTTAVLTRLSGIPSQLTYNLMIGTIFSLGFVATFSLISTCIATLLNDEASSLKKKYDSVQKKMLAALGALFGSFLLIFGGNLHPIYTFFKPYSNDNPVPFWQLAFSPGTFPNAYWYPNATRFIHNTIHEFPVYSFAVSDLHGHVLAIPIVITIIAVLFSLFIKKWQKNSIYTVLLLSILIAVSYMTDALGGIIYVLLSITVLLYLQWEWSQSNAVYIFPFSALSSYLPKSTFSKFLTNAFFVIGTLCVMMFVFALPFTIHFKPFVSGVGVLCAPDALTKIGKLGPLLFEKDHCQKSPFWQLFILHGFWYFWVISFLTLLLKRKNPKHEIRNPKQYQNTNNNNVKSFMNLNFKNLNLFRASSFDIRILPRTDLFVLILISIATLLIIIPEFVYVKDIYPAHYRANTMFKLGYQAFIMLAISSAYIIIRLASGSAYFLIAGINLKGKLVTSVYILVAILFFMLVAIYPYFAISSYYGNLQIYHGLDGTAYLKTLYPSDYDAINWINKNISGQPVILEAQGDSYTDYARVSSNTGLPTVLGWTVHEWLWRGTYDIPAPRIPEVQTLYTTSDVATTKSLLQKYQIKYIFMGAMEQQKYPTLQEQKFTQLGKIVYQNGTTKIYKIN